MRARYVVHPRARRRDLQSLAIPEPLWYVRSFTWEPSLWQRLRRCVWIICARAWTGGADWEGWF